jgi:hypothetical protein
VTLQAGINTNCTCSYASGHYSILNITDSKTFKIQGGILKYGNASLETPIKYHFMIVNGTAGPSLYFSGVQIEFVSAMNSTVLILGGKVILEDVKINNQLDTTWVSPLVFSHNCDTKVTIISISHLSSLPSVPDVKCFAWNFDGSSIMSKEDMLRFENGDIIPDVKSYLKIFD